MKQIKVGAKVQLKAKAHSWHTDNIVDCFQVHGKFKKKDYQDIVILLLSKARRAKLKGEVVGYGAQDDDFKDKRPFVKVVFKYKDMVTDFYCSEADLKRL